MNFNVEDVRHITSELSVRGYKKPTHLTFHNLTQVDIHIQVECDVEGGSWGPSQLNNNESVTVHSTETNFGNRANYCIKVWKNDNGNPGQFLCEFNHDVRFNLAGNSDLLELFMLKIDDDYYFKAFSVREGAEVVLKVIAQS